MFIYEVLNGNGDVVRNGQASSLDLAEMQAFNPGETVRLVLNADAFDMMFERPAVAITVDDVGREQRRRLSYTDGYLIRAMDDGDGRPVPEWAAQQRKAIREAAKRLEGMNPIPPDYRDERYWI